MEGVLCLTNWRSGKVLRRVTERVEPILKIPRVVRFSKSGERRQEKKRVSSLVM